MYRQVDWIECGPGTQTHSYILDIVEPDLANFDSGRVGGGGGVWG